MKIERELEALGLLGVDGKADAGRWRIWKALSVLVIAREDPGALRFLETRVQSRKLDRELSGVYGVIACRYESKYRAASSAVRAPSPSMS